jgi:hypothetical protein
MKEQDFSKELTLEKITANEIQFDYELLNGKKRNCAYLGNEKAFLLKNPQGREIEIIFRVSDDGVAFRYHFPEISDSVHYIVKELTTFIFPEETRAWLQPMALAQTGFANTNPSYEEHYLQDIPAYRLTSLPVTANQ